MKMMTKIWHSKRVSKKNAQTPIYKLPTDYILRANFLTVMPANSRGYAEVLKYGETLDDTWTMVANNTFFSDVFNVGDILWVDGLEPDTAIETQYGNGASGNAIVKNVAYDNFCIRITLVRNQNQKILKKEIPDTTNKYIVDTIDTWLWRDSLGGYLADTTDMQVYNKDRIIDDRCDIWLNYELNGVIGELNIKPIVVESVVLFFGTINDDLDLVISVLSNDFSVVAITSQGYLKTASKVGINAFKILSMETRLESNFLVDDLICNIVIEDGEGFGKLIPALQLYEWNKYELYYTYKGIEHIALLQVTYPDNPPQVIFPPPIEDGTPYISLEENVDFAFYFNDKTGAIDRFFFNEYAKNKLVFYWGYAEGFSPETLNLDINDLVITAIRKVVDTNLLSNSVECAEYYEEENFYYGLTDFINVEYKEYISGRYDYIIKYIIEFEYNNIQYAKLCRTRTNELFGISGDITLTLDGETHSIGFYDRLGEKGIYDFVPIDKTIVGSDLQGVIVHHITKWR